MLANKASLGVFDAQAQYHPLGYMLFQRDDTHKARCHNLQSCVMFICSFYSVSSNQNRIIWLLQTNAADLPLEVGGTTDLHRRFRPAYFAL